MKFIFPCSNSFITTTSFVKIMYSIDHPPPSHGSSFLLCPKTRCVFGPGYYVNHGESYATIKRSHFSNEPQNNHHIRPLHGCNNKEGEPNDFTCDACWLTTVGTTYYFCGECDCSYHKECVEAPDKINVPGYHPKHPLQLSDNIFGLSDMVSNCCGNRNIRYFYYRSICDFSMHPLCTTKTILLSIDHPKCHEHMLLYFHRKASLTCNICGLDDERHFIYICLQCDFIVHKTCIYLPRVIIISRHDHRLSFSLALPCENWLCGVCHKEMNRSYGGYICVKGCEFVAHFSCATQRNVWDGKELEGKPDEYEDITSFKKLGDGKIQYFSHPHHPLKLCENIDGVYDENTYCQACILPLCDENVYKCEDCDFNLHQTCADLPLKKRHLLHVHPLILQKDSGNHYQCEACWRILIGYTYVCSEGCYFYIDIRCSMVSEPFSHSCHPHPLFLITVTESYISCRICSSFSSGRFLDCIVCEFSSCFGCATLPYKVKYKHDNHFLKISHVTSQVEEYWCEVCEQQMNTGGIYACNSCSITLHIECAIGDLYKRPGQSFQHGKLKVYVLPNSSLARPICHYCHRRCKYQLLFKPFVNQCCVGVLCSMSCLYMIWGASTIN